MLLQCRLEACVTCFCSDESSQFFAVATLFGGPRVENQTGIQVSYNQEQRAHPDSMNVTIPDLNGV
jgi:hypothetical protein